MDDELVMAACAPERIRAWNGYGRDPDGACVVYWMARAQRASHNLALDTAIETANALGIGLVVLLNLSAGPPENDVRHVRHMLGAVAELAKGVVGRGAAFAVRGYDAPGTLSAALARLRPAVVVTDDDAMPHARAARQRVAASLPVALVSVEADVVVPTCVSGKREHAARTLRPKVQRVLERYATELGAARTRLRMRVLETLATPQGVAIWHGAHELPDAAWVERTAAAAARSGIPDLAGRTPHPTGTAAARRRLRSFVTDHLASYDTARNQPHLDLGTSGLSTPLHYGHISPHEVLAAVRDAAPMLAATEAFVEQLVVRRELAWNYALHTPDCRSYTSLPEWARASLERHAGDPRPAIHTEAEMAAAATRDPLWNAAQRQMLDTGLMHGYLRMYWAKQILTWTSTPQQAFDIALRLHDRYSVDGRDPNSVVGVAWAIGGVHDRPWPERHIFGTVRAMTFASTRRKFDSGAYVDRWGEPGVRLELG
jgi:deoxyribodipyrimidine photo-lyase